MPCYDVRDEPAYVAREYQQKVDKLTRLLCEACTVLEDKCSAASVNYPELKDHVSDELGQWWDAHQEMDRKRKAAEAKSKAARRARKDALSRMSAEDRRILGLSDQDG